MTKIQILRRQIYAECAKLTPEFQQKAAVKVADAIANTEVFARSKHIAGYMAINGEMDPMPLMQYAWEQGKNCYLPVLTKEKQLLFAIYDDGDPLINNRYAIPEPYVNANKLLDPKDLDIVITPLIGFDVNGNRLGRGGGYYDRTFAFVKQADTQNFASLPTRPLLIGIAYEFQNLSQLAAEAWDVPLDMLVTEIQVREFNNSPKSP